MKKLYLFLALFLLMSGGCKAPHAWSLQGEGSTPDPSSIQQMNSSVIFMRNDDYRLTGGVNNCMNLVDRAVKISSGTNQTINIVPTHYFLADEVNGAKVATAFCHSRVDNPLSCPLFTEDAIREFREGMAACFRHMVELGVHISVTPHLDDGKDQGVWRNNVQFDPFPGGDPACAGDTQTYFCTVLRPLAQALNEAIGPNTNVHLAMQGEMGATVFAHPGQYAKLVPVLKNIIIGSRTDVNADLIRVGLGLNHSSIFGKLPPATVHADETGKLLSAINFVALSAYITADPYPYPLMFDRAFDVFDGELNEIGLSVAAYPNLELQFSELGIGGTLGNARLASSRRETGAETANGVGSGYDLAHDPWRCSDCAQMRREFYCSALRYLSGAFENKWKVTRAYLWNLGSWDVQGLAAGTYNDSGQGYADPAVVAMIADYNRKGTTDCKETNAPPKNRQPPYPVLETFDHDNDMDLERSYSSSPDGNTVTQKVVPAFAGTFKQAMSIGFRIGDGSAADPDYAGLTKSFLPVPQAVAAHGLRLNFSYQSALSTSAPRYLILQVSDTKGQFWERIIALEKTPKGPVDIPFAGGFTKPGWYTGPDYGNPSGDQLNRFSFYINGSVGDGEKATPTQQQTSESILIGPLEWLQSDK